MSFVFSWKGREERRGEGEGGGGDERVGEGGVGEDNWLRRRDSLE